MTKRTKEERQKEKEAIIAEAKVQADRIVEAIQVKTLKSSLLPNGHVGQLWEYACPTCKLRAFIPFKRKDKPVLDAELGCMGCGQYLVPVPDPSADVVSEVGKARAELRGAEKARFAGSGAPPR